MNSFPNCLLDHFMQRERASERSGKRRQRQQAGERASERQITITALIPREINNVIKK